MNKIIEFIANLFRSVQINNNNNYYGEGGGVNDGKAVVAGGGNKKVGADVLEKDSDEEEWPKKIDEKLFLQINTYFEGKVKLVSQVLKCPKIEVVPDSDFGFNEKELEEVKKERDKLDECNRPNDIHAILEGDPDWNANPVSIKVKRVDYAELTVLRRKLDPPPRVVTSNVLLVCRESGEVLLHKRSKDVATDAGKLHVFGGGYAPGYKNYKGEKCRSNDSRDLKLTASRELDEATTIKLPISENETYMVLAFDDSCPGFSSFQFNYVACEIQERVVKDAFKTFEDKKESEADDNILWEGSLVKYPFENFMRMIENDDFEDSMFALSGKAHLMLWVALGCPGMNKEPWRANSAKEVFDRIIKKRRV